MGFTFGEAVKLEAYLSMVLIKTFENAIKNQESKAPASSQNAPKKEDAPPKTESAEDDLW